MPPPVREGFAGRIFGCDVCQEVCPWNHRPAARGRQPVLAPRRCRRCRPPRSPRSAPDEFERLAAGMAVARARYDGLRRNALYAIGSAARRRRPAPWWNAWSTTAPTRRARRRGRLGARDRSGRPQPEPTCGGRRVRYDRHRIDGREAERRGQGSDGRRDADPARGDRPRPSPNGSSSGRRSTRCCCTTTTTRRRNSWFTC